MQPKASDRYVFKHIVGLMFHPVYSNVVFVMQEGGDVHAVDAQIGEVVAENVAQVQANSSWALDEENMRVFVCGDLGKAILYDISMGASATTTNSNLPKGHKEWKIVRFWFTAHQISKNDAYFVNTVKFSKAAGMFITGSSIGEVKLWSAIDCQPLGLLNAKQWASETIQSHIKKWDERKRK